MTPTIHPAEACPICRHRLRCGGMRLAWVQGVAYHAACYVLLAAPSAAAGTPSGAGVN